MRIVFMGTPQFAVPSLRAVAAEHEVLKVITQPDRPAGRGRKLSAPPVKQSAEQMALPVSQPEKASSSEVVQDIGALHAELIVVVGYGQIISEDLLNAPKLGAVNVHASLLPRYRGAAPIQRAVINGDKETGVTTMWMTPHLDAGDIILQKRIPILPDDTAGTLGERLAVEGAVLLVETVRQMAQGIAPRLPQDHSLATLAPRVLPHEGEIDWAADSQAICNLVRGLNPAPGAFTFRNQDRLKVWKARPILARREGIPGAVIEVETEGFSVCAGTGAVLVTEVQPESRRKMPAAAYARGYRLAPGDILGPTEERADERSRC